MESSSDWKSEVEAVIADISSCVGSAALCSGGDLNTPSDLHNRVAYFNIETKEKERICVRLDPEGFSVVGRGKFDDRSLESRVNQKYETIYALLNNLSPSYTLTFAQNLTEKLRTLQKVNSDKNKEQQQQQQNGK